MLSIIDVTCRISGRQNMDPTAAYNVHERIRRLSSNDTFLLPMNFTPTGKDVICGRARENFHHDGNRYFRELIRKSIGPYLAARTKTEKSDAIASIVEQVQRNSPLGGFVKKDNISGRWYRIKENEARDKVGHAIRKAVQRMEETRPKTVQRLKMKTFTPIDSQSGQGAAGTAEEAEPKASSVQEEDPQTTNMAKPAAKLTKEADAGVSRYPRTLHGQRPNVDVKNFASAVSSRKLSPLLQRESDESTLAAAERQARYEVARRQLHGGANSGTTTIRPQQPSRLLPGGTPPWALGATSLLDQRALNQSRATRVGGPAVFGNLFGVRGGLNGSPSTSPSLAIGRQTTEELLFQAIQQQESNRRNVNELSRILTAPRHQGVSPVRPIVGYPPNPQGAASLNVLDTSLQRLKQLYDSRGNGGQRKANTADHFSKANK